MENVTFWAASGGKRMSPTEALTEIPGLLLCCPSVLGEQGRIPRPHPAGRVSQEGFGHARDASGAHTEQQPQPTEPHFPPWHRGSLLGRVRAVGAPSRAGSTPRPAGHNPQGQVCPWSFVWLCLMPRVLQGRDPDTLLRELPAGNLIS